MKIGNTTEFSGLINYAFSLVCKWVYLALLAFILNLMMQLNIFIVRRIVIYVSKNGLQMLRHYIDDFFAVCKSKHEAETLFQALYISFLKS